MEYVVSGLRSLFSKWAVLAVMLAAGSVASLAQFMQPPDTKRVSPPGLEHVTIEQKLDAQVPLNLQFKDEQGRAVKLGDYFHAGKPVLLTLVYYECPMLCGEVLNGATAAMKVLKFTPGNEYEVVTVSIDPRETPDLALAKKQSYMERLDRPGAEKGWHFLTGNEPDIKALADAVGWEYQYDPKTKQFAHAAGIVLLTPQGRVAQYYYGVEYSAKDLRLGMVEASKNKIGTIADRVLLYCYHYDPRTGAYGAVITNIMRAAGGATVLILGSFLVLMFRREGHDKRHGIGRA
ncbi:MAG TPA: SCO family protein [Clostridia bacterium]|nr:SCO family protein [Clostridia bacterium]